MAAETKIPKIENPDQGISLKVAGSLIGCSDRQARSLAEKGELKAYRVGSPTWRTTPRAVREFQGGSGGDK